MRGGGRFLAAVAALLVGAAPAPATDPPVRLAAAFEDGARLGAGTGLHVGLRVDTRQRPAPLRSVRVRYDANLGVTTSGLGTSSCRRPQAAYEAVVVPYVAYGRAGCPRNSVMAVGTARGEIRLGSDLPIPEEAIITVFAGPVTDGRLQVEAQVDGVNPIGAKLVFAGEILSARPPWGGTLSLALPPLPPRWGADITLVAVELVIGAREIIYRDPRSGALYRPDGIQLPSRCPRGGFRVEVEFVFADGRRDVLGRRLPCPPRGSR
jgi:hypothetical protein